MSDRPYSRIYHQLADEFPAVYDSTDLASYCRLLVAADQAFPTSARWAGCATRAVMDRLVKAGLVTIDGQRYRIRGMDKERAQRSKTASDNATARWDRVREQQAMDAAADAESMQSHSGRNAMAMLDKTSRDETSKDETRRALSAREGLPNITTDVQEAGEAITGQGILAAGDKQLTELDRLVESHGPAAVVKAFAAVANGQRLAWRQLVWGTMKQLEPIPGSLSKADAKEAEREEAKRKFLGGTA